MGCASSKTCYDSDCELPEHRKRSHDRKSHTHRKGSRSHHYFYSTRSRRSSNTSISSRTPMVQTDSVADMRAIIASMGGWHEEGDTHIQDSQYAT